MTMEVDKTLHMQAVLPQSFSNRPRDAQPADLSPVSPDLSADATSVSRKIEQLVEKVNQAVQQSSLKFRYERELKTAVVEVVDTRQNRVIRQIPSDEALARLQQISDYLRQHIYSRSGESPPMHKDELTGLIMQAIS